MRYAICVRRALQICCALLATQLQLRAIILLDDAAETANTSEPAGALAGSGWQYEGDWGWFLGTPIAPHFFISANHVGRAGDVFSYRGNTYTLSRSTRVAGTDLLVWEVVETFPDFAPLYSRPDEVGKPLVVIGRGTERGETVLVNNELRGWKWGNGNGVRRWGQNVVADVISYLSSANQLLYATFDKPAPPNESHLSGGDSGGAVFINDNGVWKLAGINFAVDGPFYTAADDATAFNAALWDVNGLWIKDGGFVQVNSTAPVPTGFYSTRISTQVAAIYSIIDPLADPDRDGISNMLEYALHLDPLVPDVTGLPTLDRSGDTVALVYRKNAAASDLTFSVEQSYDLLSWSPAQSQDEIVSDTNGTQIVRATISGITAPRFFLRLRVTRP